MMVTQKIPLEPGNFGWAVRVMNYPLPAGLPHRSIVKIIRNVVGDTQIHVEDAAGRPWSLLRGNILPRLRYRSHNGVKFYPEHSHGAQNIISNEIAHLEKQLESLQYAIEELYWAVRRSGNAPAIAALEQRLAVHNPLGDFVPEISDICHPNGPNQR